MAPIHEAPKPKPRKAREQGRLEPHRVPGLSGGLRPEKTREVFRTWVQHRIQRHEQGKLLYQKAVKKIKLGGKRLSESSAAGRITVKTARFFGPIHERDLMVIWRNITPEGRHARNMLLTNKRSGYINKHGTDKGLKEFNKWLIKERLGFTLRTGASALIIGTTATGAVELMPLAGVASHLTGHAISSAIENVGMRASIGIGEYISETGAARLAGKIATRATEHTLADSLKHAIEKRNVASWLKHLHNARMQAKV